MRVHIVDLHENIHRIVLYTHQYYCCRNWNPTIRKKKFIASAGNSVALGSLDHHKTTGKQGDQSPKQYPVTHTVQRDSKIEPFKPLKSHFTQNIKLNYSLWTAGPLQYIGKFPSRHHLLSTYFTSMRDPLWSIQTNQTHYPPMNRHKPEFNNHLTITHCWIKIQKKKKKDAF